LVGVFGKSPKLPRYWQGVEIALKTHAQEEKEKKTTHTQ